MVASFQWSLARVRTGHLHRDTVSIIMQRVGSSCFNLIHVSVIVLAFFRHHPHHRDLGLVER